MKNIAVGPLSAVSPETLESVFLVLRWYLDGRRHAPPGAGIPPSWQDEQVARDFAQAIRLAETLRAYEEGERE
jgi:hypothetical protein